MTNICEIEIEKQNETNAVDTTNLSQKVGESLVISDDGDFPSSAHVVEAVVRSAVSLQNTLEGATGLGVWPISSCRDYPGNLAVAFP